METYKVTGLIRKRNGLIPIQTKFRAEKTVFSGDLFDKGLELLLEKTDETLVIESVALWEKDNKGKYEPVYPLMKDEEPY